jgi:hypothetical protein
MKTQTLTPRRGYSSVLVMLGIAAALSVHGGPVESARGGEHNARVAEYLMFQHRAATPNARVAEYRMMQHLHHGAG